MAQKFEAGDIVRLITGGPQMVVEGFNSENEVSCVWFDKREDRQSYLYIAEALVKE